jgi:hypothetical protein
MLGQLDLNTLRRVMKSANYEAPRHTIQTILLLFPSVFTVAFSRTSRGCV